MAMGRGCAEVIKAVENVWKAGFGRDLKDVYWRGKWKTGT